MSIVSVAILTALGVWAFGRGGSKTTNDTPGIRLVNDTANSNTGSANGNANANANSNSSSNTNTTTGTVAPTSLTSDEMTAIVKQCSTALSSVSTGSGLALTFDISADNEATGKLLEVLKAKNTPASFFVTGSYAKDHSELLQRLINAGYPVYSRGTSVSKHFGTMTAAAVTSDLVSAESSIRAASDQTSKPFFRPPYGETTPDQVKAAQTAGYCTMLWTIDGNDWDNSQTVDGAVTRVMDKVKNGAVVLLHAGYDITPDVVTQLLAQLPAKNLVPVSLSSLFAPGD
jgi:peptidoglycan/xylan/chitin deacetylase (PgdA/CDA1 family)